ncbi:hypothetical protein, partial [Cereibacter changlensis]|uniref:hypothetical protein n=1 Tax=Cereibacter changlensis TaxID=402884 RepID=UPI001B807F58
PRNHLDPAIISVFMPALKHGISFDPIHSPVLLASQATNLRTRPPSRKMPRSWRSLFIGLNLEDEVD